MPYIRSGTPQQDRETTSYRRFSDERWRHADSGTARRAQTPLPVHVSEAQQLEAWGEGGNTAYVEPGRILIVDNDTNTAAAGAHAGRIGRSANSRRLLGARRASIAAEFQPDVVLLGICGIGVATKWRSRCVSTQEETTCG